jgi:hypothetical protein
VDTTAQFNPAGQQTNARFGRLISVQPASHATGAEIHILILRT